MIIHTQNCKAAKCKKNFRARRDHRLCRKCHQIEHNEARPIASRELSENKFRRTRSRRTASKAISISKKGKK